MIEFFQALLNQPYMQHAMLAGLLASVSCGIIGSYVVVRRISYLAGGIAHSVLGGIGAAMYMQRVLHWEFVTPILGAVVAALLAALIIGLVSLRAKQREDTVIGALWAVGMAVGVIFVSQTPGYNADLMSYLFGNILLVSGRDLWLIVVLDVVVLGLGLVFYNQFLAVCFDEEAARLRGLRVEFYYLLLLCLTALTVVLLSTVVGLVLVIALLTIPAAVAGHFSRTLWQMMIGAAVLTMALTTAGQAVSFGPGLPAGSMTIVLAGGLYLLTITGRWLFRRLRRSKSS